MPHQGEIYFALYGDDFDPEEVTRIVGLAPTSSQRRGNPRPKATVWRFSTGKRMADLLDFYEMASELVAQLRPVSAGIVQAKTNLGLSASLQLVISFSPDETISMPIIGFDPEVISFLSAIGANIDIDTYRF